MQTTPYFVIRAIEMDTDKVQGYLSDNIARGLVKFGMPGMQVFTSRSQAQMAQRTWAKWFASRGAQLVITDVVLSHDNGVQRCARLRTSR